MILLSSLCSQSAGTGTFNSRLSECLFSCVTKFVINSEKVAHFSGRLVNDQLWSETKRHESFPQKSMKSLLVSSSHPSSETK
jgi:hypothetical protein